MSEVRFKIENPTSGGWFCFDLVVESYGRYADLIDDSRWYRRLWHRICGRAS